MIISAQSEFNLIYLELPQGVSGLKSGRSGLRAKIFKFKARIAPNSGLLRRLAALRLDVLDSKYEFMA